MSGLSYRSCNARRPRPHSAAPFLATKRPIQANGRQAHSAIVIPPPGNRRGRRAITEFLTALAGGVCLGAVAAHALDGQWFLNPVDNDWNNGSNWTSAPAVPSGNAQFGPSNGSSITFRSDSVVQEIEFLLGSATTYNFFQTAHVLTVFGIGILPDFESPAPTFAQSQLGALVFHNTSSASLVGVKGGSGLGTVITNTDSAFTSFNDQSTAGFASIQNSNNPFTLQAGTIFNDHSTAGSAKIVNSAQGVTVFNDFSSAGNAMIFNDGGTTVFLGSPPQLLTGATAANATIENSNGGSTSFEAKSTAGSANIVNNAGGSTIFEGLATSASAFITNQDSTATTQFEAHSVAGSKTQVTSIINVLDGVTDFRDQTSAAYAHITNGNPALPGGGTLNFFDTSTANAATILNQGAGQTVFHNNSDAGFGSDPATITNTSGGQTVFRDSSSAGIANITNLNGSTTFHDTSQGAEAVITNNTGGSTLFHEKANAQNIIIINNAGGLTQFFENSNAGNASITNNNGGETDFFGQSNAGDAFIFIKDGGSTFFHDQSHGGNANILASTGGTLQFLDQSTPDAPAILNAIVNNSGLTLFKDQSTGGLAQIINNAGGVVDLSGLTTTGMTAGSIAGAGNFFLGSKALTVGGNNLSTEVSGVIADSGLSGGKGGSLSKVGTGTLILSGANIYTGGTTISDGILQLGNGRTSGSILGNVIDNAILAINRSDAFTFGGLISGTGAFQQIGAGTTILTNNNTFSGGTTIAAGALQLGNGGTSGSVLGNVIDNSIFAINHSNTLAIGGVISGTGEFQQLGTGTTTLAGLNTYAGPTTVAAGTLQAGVANALPATTAMTIAPGAAFNLNGFNQSIGSLAGAGGVALGAATLTTGGNGTSTEFAGVVSGSGGLTKRGTGVFTLTGANTYTGVTTIAGGTLQLGKGGTSGSILGNVIDNGVLIFNHSDAVTFDGAISGTGAVRQNGSGATTFTGASTYTGPTDVNAGKLIVNGSLASIVNVNSGTTLMGSGTVGGFNAGGGATLAPGNSIGTLTVAGNATFNSGATYQVEANAAGQADKIVASGTAMLGGAVQVLAAGGAYASSTDYTILTAAGGVSNTFANVTSNLAFLNPSLSYTANSVLLTLSRNATLLTSVAQTANQHNVAQALDTAPTNDPVYLPVISQSIPAARQAFDALSGEAHADVQSTMIDDSLYIRQAVLGRMRQVPYVGVSGPMSALATGGPALAYSDNGTAAGASPVLAYADGSSPPIFVKTMPDKAAPPSLPQTRYAYWAQSFGAWGNFGSNGNSADVGRKFGGFMSGIDARFAGNWQAGFAGGYSQSNITISDRSSSALVDTAHAAAYAATSVGAWNLRAGAAFAWHIVDTNRTVDFPGFFDRDTANYHANTAQVFGEIGYGMALGPLALEPFAGIAHVRLSSNGFAETGGDAKLSVASTTDDVTYSTLGLRAAADFALATNFVVTPRVTGAWQHAFGGVTPTDTLTFQSAATTFAIWGVPVTRDSLLVDAGFDVRLTPQFKVGASYFGQFASRVRDNAVKGDLTWSF